MPIFEFTNIQAIDAEVLKLVATFGGQKNAANDAKLDTLLTKWVKDAEDNNVAYDVAVKLVRKAPKA